MPTPTRAAPRPHPPARAGRSGRSRRDLGADGVLTALLAAGHLPSLLLWGPPGCGKTTIAQLLADAHGLRFAPFSAVLGGVGDLRKLLDEAASMRTFGEGTLLFIDEIHRFNKAQQDALLPHVESGAVTFIGATDREPVVQP